MGRRKPGYSQFTVYLPTAVHNAFRAMSMDQDFSMSDKLAAMIETLVLDSGYYLPRKNIREYGTLAELVDDTFSFLKEYSKVSTASLQAICQGKQPTEIDLLRLGMALKMTQNELDDLYNRSFPHGEHDDDKQ